MSAIPQLEEHHKHLQDKSTFKSTVLGDVAAFIADETLCCTNEMFDKDH